MELIIAVIILLALLVAWFVLPGSKPEHSETKPEAVPLSPIQPQA